MNRAEVADFALDGVLSMYNTTITKSNNSYHLVLRDKGGEFIFAASIRKRKPGYWEVLVRGTCYINGQLTTPRARNSPNRHKCLDSALDEAINWLNAQQEEYWCAVVLDNDAWLKRIS